MRIQGWLAIGLAGALLCAPIVHAASGGSVSATCKDGTTWTGKSHSGACRGHQGVQSWSDDSASSNTQDTTASSDTHKSHSKKSTSSETSEASGGMSSSSMGGDTAASGGASATCKDGTSWSGKSHSGACRGHGGVQSWGEQSAASTPASGSMTSSKSSTPSTSSMSSTGNAANSVTATCKDGTSWSGKSHSGACRGHQGVQSWSDTGNASAAASKPMPPPPITPAAPAPAPTPMSPRPSNTPMSKPVARSAPTPAATPAPGGGNGKVWVNASTKVYHCSNDRWYGKTKNGEYMSESQAKAQGFRPDHGKACS